MRATIRNCSNSVPDGRKSGDGLTKIENLALSRDESIQAENFRKIFRKIFLSMSEDIRVILIKLADRLHNMRTLESMPPEKQWKITEEDWRNREKWPEYEVAVDEMLQKTSTKNAPWFIIESNDKLYARIKTLKIIVHELEKACKHHFEQSVGVKG